MVGVGQRVEARQFFEKPIVQAKNGNGRVDPWDEPEKPSKNSLWFALLRGRFLHSGAKNRFLDESEAEYRQNVDLVVPCVKKWKLRVTFTFGMWRRRSSVLSRSRRRGNFLKNPGTVVSTREMNQKNSRKTRYGSHCCEGDFFILPQKVDFSINLKPNTARMLIWWCHSWKNGNHVWLYCEGIFLDWSFADISPRVQNHEPSRSIPKHTNFKEIISQLL